MVNEGVQNSFPISFDAPVFVNASANGKLFTQNSVSPPLYVLHVYGTAYEMGYAQGELMKEQLNELFPEVRKSFSF